MTKDKALDLALEALEYRGDYRNKERHTKRQNAITAIKQARSAPVQEPVAVVDANDEGYWADILPDRSVKVGQLLYPAAQRQWVGLTDKERMMCRSYDADETVAKTEAKLKEKNGGSRTYD